MLTLKEAFSYHKYLDKLNADMGLLGLKDINFLKITALHNKHAANPEEEDYIVDMTLERTLPGSPDDLIGFYAFIVEEKISLTQKIHEAKKTLPIDLDVELTNNKLRRYAAANLSMILRDKNKKKDTEETAYAYRFNAEGNQVRYMYNVIKTYEVDYDRAKTKALSNRYKDEAERLSKEIEKVLLLPCVDYTPKIVYDECLEDAFKAYLDMEINKDREAL